MSWAVRSCSRASPRNTLAERLQALTEEGILERRPYQEGPVRYEYVLTQTGEDLYPVLLAMLRWGNKHMVDLLPQIQTPVQIIAGRHDPAVPPVNAEFLHDRLPHSKLDLLDAGHFTWEDAADEYAQLVSTWWGGGYAITGSAAAR